MKYFISTPIFYVNAAPHIGHLHSAILADAFQRWQRLLNGSKSSTIVFATGTDEHGTKVEKAAAAKGHNDVRSYCDSISDHYRTVFRNFGVDFSHFLRTTDDRHKKVVQSTWEKMRSNNYIYKDNYSGWYCVQDETFLTDLQLKTHEYFDRTQNKNIVQKVSTESGHPVEWITEENYKFKLSHFQNDLIYWLEKNENVIKPREFHSQTLQMLHGTELHDISISRPKMRVNWAIPVPGDAQQTIYVWFDALCYYLTISEFSSGIWPPDVQIIGKDIIKFHAIYWPAFLMALKYDLPKLLFVHSHWTVDDEKMSKSKNNVVDPETTARKFTEEGLRYFLLREAVPYNDSNYNETKVARILNAELADSLGNLLSRCCYSSAINPKSQYPPCDVDTLKDLMDDAQFCDFFSNLVSLANNVRKHFEDGNFHKVCDLVIGQVHRTNSFFEANKPWQLAKDPQKMKQLETVLHLTMESLRTVAILLQPIIPQLATRILDELNIPQENRFFVDSQRLSWSIDDASAMKTGHSLQNFRKILFQKIPSSDARNAHGKTKVTV